VAVRHTSPERERYVRRADRSVVNIQTTLSLQPTRQYAAWIAVRGRRASYGMVLSVFLGSWLAKRGLSHDAITIGSKWATPTWARGASTHRCKMSGPVGRDAPAADARKAARCSLPPFNLYQIHSATLESACSRPGCFARRHARAVGLASRDRQLTTTAEVIRRALDAPVNGESPFQGRVMRTWNLLEPSPVPRPRQRGVVGGSSSSRSPRQTGRLTDRGGA